MSDLRPCWQCGGKPVLQCDDWINGRPVERPDWYVECAGAEIWCGAHTRSFKTAASACRAWNEGRMTKGHPRSIEVEKP